jgi:tRNA(Ile)-lysidine synthase
MKALLDRVRRFVREHALFGPHDRIVAAVSGGSDSVALACILLELHNRGEAHLAGVAHFNHQLRETAVRDEQHTAALAARLGMPILIDRADVAAQAAANRQSIETAARNARYTFFERARRHFAADVIALGHTRDDQAETFLLRLLRGAGPRGLGGMHPHRGFIVRPLLACRRPELTAYLASLSVPFVQDESNDDVAIPRNRVRAELIPFLAARFNPSIVDGLANEAELARETWQMLDEHAARWIAAHVRPAADGRQFEVAVWATLSSAMRRAVLWQVMNGVAARLLGFRHVARALEVAGASGPSAMEAPGVRVERVGPVVVLTSRGCRARYPDARNRFRYLLSVPGEVRCPAAGWTVTAELPGWSESVRLNEGALSGDGHMALVQGNRLVRGLAVRNRRDGDRFNPAGLQGHKKLQDFFVDLKIARRERDDVPLVVDENDRIVWVAGHRIDETFRVTDGAQPMLLLRLKQT